METVFYLIRHGESLANLQGRCCGHADWDLTPLGMEQAAATAACFRDVPIDVILSSDLSRARHTAQPIAEEKGLPVLTDPGFREIFVGEWESRTFEEVSARYPEAYAVWRSDMFHAEIPGGEDLTRLYRRVRQALDRAAAAYPGKTVLIATHATPIRVLGCVLSGRRLEETAQIPPVSNASVTKIVYRDGAYVLEQYGQFGHLDQLNTDADNSI